MPPTLQRGGDTWELARGDTTVGRQDTCDIVIRDNSLSRAHATFTYGRQGVSVLDNNSSNGTFINGTRMNSAELKDGDLVKLGHLDFRFEWPESRNIVSASPISFEDAAKMKQALTKKSVVVVDWKVPLTSVAMFGAITTGVVAGIAGAIMSQSTQGTAGPVIVAGLIGVLGGMGAGLLLKAQMTQRVSGPLTNFKDDLDLFFGGAKPALDMPAGFPELTDSVIAIEKGANMLRERVGNEWRYKLHEAQMAVQAQQAAAELATSRGFTAPILGIDDQFRLQAWTTGGRGLLRPDVAQPAGTHFLQVMHNQALGGAILNAMAQTGPGQLQVLARVWQSAEDGSPQDCIISHAPGGSPTYRYVVYMLPSA